MHKTYDDTGFDQKVVVVVVPNRKCAVVGIRSRSDLLSIHINLCASNALELLNDERRGGKLVKGGGGRGGGGVVVLAM